MIETILTDMPIQPLAKDLEIGVNTFETAFDTVTQRTKAFTEMAKVGRSELAPIYLIKDSVYGETLVAENAYTRNGLRVPDATFDNSMKAVDPKHGKNVINRFVNKAYPKETDTNISVLFSLNNPIRIKSGETIYIRGNYTDPNGGSAIVGVNMIVPVVTTDYLSNVEQDGTGANMSASLTVTATYGSAAVDYEITNAYASGGWITHLQARGYIVYQYSQVEKAAEDSDSQDEFGYQEVVLKQQYQQDPQTGYLYGEKVVDREKQPRLVLNQAVFIANRTDALMTAWLTRDVGDMVYIIEDKSEIDGYYYIMGVAFSISAGGVVKFSWLVRGMVSLLLGLSLISCEFDTASEDCLEYGYLPQLVNLEDRSYSFWINTDTVAIDSRAVVAIFGDEAGNVVRATENEAIEIIFKGVSGPFLWATANNSLTLNDWVHVVLTGVGTDVANNDPLIYFDAVSMAIAGGGILVDALENETGLPFFIGNVKTTNTDYAWPFDGDIKDVRIFDKNLTQAEVTTLEAGGDVDDGLVFQSPCVRTSELSDFEDLTLTSANKMIDNMYGSIGTPHASPVTRLIP